MFNWFSHAADDTSWALCWPHVPLTWTCIPAEHRSRVSTEFVFVVLGLSPPCRVRFVSKSLTNWETCLISILSKSKMSESLSSSSKSLPECVWVNSQVHVPRLCVLLGNEWSIFGIVWNWNCLDKTEVGVCHESATRNSSWSWQL